MESGHISIHADNILPIIKRWLYSEKEIFLRELVSNAADALTKLHKLSLVGEADNVAEAKITITIDETANTLTITDTGIGLNEDEVKKYINQVAYSGLNDFVAKYKDKDDSSQVIGHFGLGFYSAFMVADKVEIDSLSYRPGEKAIRWSCDGSTEYKLDASERKEVGTSIILHINDDSKDMLNEERIKGLINKFCAFIRFPISFKDETVNDPTPLWTRSASELKDEDYLEFFRKMFPMQPEPLFWIHLNVDYPFNLKGILFFPKLQHELDASSGEVKLYCNQVYVADNTKELIPEFLTLLKGVIDCPDLPLNVSRSYLQTDPTVKKISEHITKKVADKLTGLAKTDRESYEKFWDDIAPFVKYGMMRDEKFNDKLADHLIFKTSKGEYKNLEEIQASLPEGSSKETLYYASDETAQASFIHMLEDEGVPVIVASTMIDAHFMPFLEMKNAGKLKFYRVDSQLAQQLVGQTASEIIDPSDNKTQSQRLEDVFKKVLGSDDKIKIRVEALKSETTPAVILEDEQMRRMKEMSHGLAAFTSQLNSETTLLVNKSSKAVKNLLTLSKAFNRDAEVELVAKQIYDLACLQQGKFTPEMMKGFIERSSELLAKVGADNGTSEVLSNDKSGDGAKTL